MDFESVKAVEPDIEVVVRSGEQEIAVIGVFQNKSDVWDLVVGVDSSERREQLVTLFTAITSAIQVATFAPVHSAGDL